MLSYDIVTFCFINNKKHIIKLPINIDTCKTINELMNGLKIQLGDRVNRSIIGRETIVIDGYEYDDKDTKLEDLHINNTIENINGEYRCKIMNFERLNNLHYYIYYSE